jgi:hypothetical protein
MYKGPNPKSFLIIDRLRGKLLVDQKSGNLEKTDGIDKGVYTFEGHAENSKDSLLNDTVVVSFWIYK